MQAHDIVFLIFGILLITFTLIYNSYKERKEEENSEIELLETKVHEILSIITQVFDTEYFIKSVDFIYDSDEKFNGLYYVCNFRDKQVFIKYYIDNNFSLTYNVKELNSSVIDREELELFLK
mgnify:CR=1 FL=1